MFVLDSSDKLRLSVAKDELQQLLSHPGENLVPNLRACCLKPVLLLYNTGTPSSIGVCAIN